MAPRAEASTGWFVQRLKPKLVIIGAQKAGTTTLFDLLSHHPRIIPPRRKEISFFSNDERYAKGLEDYWAQFPRRSIWSGRRITFEASPMYLFNPLAAERIARHLPGALCLVVLRDPVQRAYSAWNMYRDFKDSPRHAHRHDPRTFEEAIAEELAGKLDIPARRYLQRSSYAPQLRRYFDAVGSERTMVVGFPRLKTDAHGLVSEILQGLRLDPLPKDHPAFTVRSNVRDYVSPVDPMLEVSLRAYFEPDRLAVIDLLGRDLKYHENP